MSIEAAILKTLGRFKDEEVEAQQRVADLQQKIKARDYQPTLQEVWFTGWTNHNGTVKKGIFQTKITDSDKAKLQEVYEAIQTGEIGLGVADMKKFTKAHATRLYKALQEKRRDAIIKDIIETMPDNYHLVNNFDGFSHFMKLIKEEEEFAIDTETTGLDYFRDEIVGLSFTLPKADYHCYIPVRHTEGRQLPADYVFEKLKPILENTTQKKILFNAKFDIHMLRREDIKLRNAWFDGYVAMKLLNENEESYALKNLSTKYGKNFGFEDRSVTYEELFGRGGFQDAQFITSDGRRGVAVFYTCKDTHLTYRFYKDFVMKHFDRLPKLKNLYFNIERPITDICVEMEQAGLRIDMEYASKYGKTLQAEITDLEREISKHLGDININSNQQLSEVLYDKLRLDKYLPKGIKRSVDAKTLEKLAAHNEGVKILLKYRELNKLYSTYVLPMPEKTVNGYLHGQFLQVQTATGRFASQKPNLQNLPKEARSMFIPSIGMIMFAADYSQIEPRVLAHFTQDESMINAYVTGRDLYVEMAMKVFNLEEKYCVDKAKSPDGSFEPRKAVKSVLLGIMYGMGSKTLSQNLKMSEERAKQIINDFFAAFPKVKAWMDEQIKFAEENEYIETMFGRKRRFKGFKQIAKRYHAVCAKLIDLVGELPDFIWDEDYKWIPYDIKREYWDMGKSYTMVTRRVINTIIQGSAADIMKLAMIETYKIVEKYDWKIIATIHDEVIFEVPLDVKKSQIEELEKAMLSVVNLKTPMKCDSVFMERWGEEVPKDKWFAAAA